MKHIIIILLFVPFGLFSQSQFWNTSCQTATFIPPNFDLNLNSKSVTNQPGCSGAAMKLYYYYHSTDSTGSPSLIIGYSTSVNSTYKVFGPFSSYQEGCNTLPGSLLATSTAAGLSQAVTHQVATDAFYILEISVNSCSLDLTFSCGNCMYGKFSSNWETTECVDCIPGFRPKAGTYVVSAWVRDASVNGTITTFTKPYLAITTNSTVHNLLASGEIIDGWQRIEDTIQVLTDFDFSLVLQCATSGDCYFDDIRIFPKDGSMMTYVYDPLTLRLMAELDERNYAKLYEYDEEGKLIRVKKETEKGVMTIQETRENNSSE